MSQEKKSHSFPGKAILIAIFSSFVSLIVLLAISSRVLMAFDHFERYYEIVCYLVYIILALFLAYVARRVTGSPSLFSVIVSLSVCILSLAFGLIWGGGHFDLVHIGPRDMLYIAISVLFASIPQKKKQKEYEAMQSAIKVGTRIMTIGRLVGTVVAINTDNTIEVDIGTKGNPVIILINREGIGLNLDAQQVAPDSKGDIKANSSEGDVDADEATFTEADSSEEKKDDEI